MIDDAYYFCANPHCPLHVRPGDAGVHGRGDWASFSDRIIIGRSKVAGFMLCDRCAGRVIRGELKVPAPEE